MKLIIFATLVAIALTQHKPLDIEYLSMGYNIYLGNPLSNSTDPGFLNVDIFNLLYTQNMTTADGTYFMPNNVNVASDASCVISSASTAISGMNSYDSSLESFVSVSGGCPFGSFSASDGYQSMLAESSAGSTFFTLSTAQCSVYTADVDVSDLPELADQFIEDAVNYLGQDESDLYYQFLNRYGTHFVQEITMGSRLSILSSLSASSWQNLEAMSIVVTAAAHASFLGCYLTTSTSDSTANAQTTAFSDASSTFQMCSIGTMPNGDLTDWADETNNSPMPIQYSLVPLNEIFSSSKFASRINESQVNISAIQNNAQSALEGYCGYLNTQQGEPTNCSPLGSDEPVPTLTGACVLCASECGGIYSQNGGSFDYEWDQPGWFWDFPNECGSSTLDQNSFTGGVQLCCLPEVPNEITGSCRMCSSCGGQFIYREGGDMDNLIITNWMAAYGESCSGNIIPETGTATGFSLCCDQPNVCEMCVSCGGEFPYENGVLGVGDITQAAFSTFGAECSGTMTNGTTAPSIGLRFCCQNQLNPNLEV